MSTKPDTARDAQHATPLRIMVFPDRPDCLVVYLSRGSALHLPAIPHPFTQEGVSAACRDSELDFRLTVGTPGNWRTAYRKLHAAEFAERGQRNREVQAIKNTERRNSDSLVARSRGEAIDRKNKIDEEVRSLKSELGMAKTRAFESGVYLPASLYRSKERRLQALKDESQALQSTIAQLRDQERETQEMARQTYSMRFERAAHQLLSEDLLQRIHGLAAAASDEDDE